MEIFHDIQKLRQLLDSKRLEGKNIGFVPTMGYLHKGHLSLIKNSAKENDITVLSIYVNPTQFGPNEDLDNYPSDLDNDIKIAKEAGADIIFIPNNEMMYLDNHVTYVNVHELTNNLCGLSRPTHFQGVTTIVTKLFNIVQPKRAYFGQKDAQQAIIIKRMVKDLNIPVDVVICPIIRENDGLAMSSRNTYLNQQERSQATVLYESLQQAKILIEAGESNSSVIKNTMEDIINSKPSASIDYINIVSQENLKDIATIKGNILIAIAVKIGNTRLIDNIQMEV